MNVRRCILSLLKSISNDQGHELAVVIDIFIFERRATFTGAALFFESAGGTIELIEIAMMKNGEDARHSFSLGGIDSRNFSIGNRAGDSHAVREFFDGIIRGIFSAARNFQLSIYAGDRFTNY